MRGPRRLGGVLALAAAVVLVGCGVEVPDDVADATTTTAASEPATTAPPMSEDDIEQALIDNGYTADEARCGAENLREQLSDRQIEELFRSDINEIEGSIATAFSAAVQPCLDAGG